jgi:hypothetical protein
MLKNIYGDFHLWAYPEQFHLWARNEFFDCFVEQWLENKEIPVVIWSYANVKSRHPRLGTRATPPLGKKLHIRQKTTS